MKIVILSRVVSPIGKDPRRSLEAADLSDTWDETNITCCGFRHMLWFQTWKDYGFRTKTSWYSKKENKNKKLLYW